MYVFIWDLGKEQVNEEMQVHFRSSLSLCFSKTRLLYRFSVLAFLPLLPSLFDTLLAYCVPELLFHTVMRYQVMLALRTAMHTFWYTAMTINRFTRSAPTSNAAGNVRVLLLCGMQKARLQEHIFKPTSLSGFEMCAAHLVCELFWS